MGRLGSTYTISNFHDPQNPRGQQDHGMYFPPQYNRDEQPALDAKERPPSFLTLSAKRRRLEPLSPKTIVQSQQYMMNSVRDGIHGATQMKRTGKDTTLVVRLGRTGPRKKAFTQGNQLADQKEYELPRRLHLRGMHLRGRVLQIHMRCRPVSPLLRPRQS